ncbi:isochorismatase family protein [Jeongeupia naejangsanensis]|uniref:Isochorismatase family protein n=1 Tax=Jeongeupia naejangsanensis TaxID=613195 RepID=A0ABS2BHL8_9NEIS|nr:isochorismatase family protein [Jeongeupia naejangsanensis]MBM3115109.1 isochorismatase family protein [Jeongeupia naejangsanensis]
MKALVVIDIQREYIAEGRKFQIRSIGPSLKNAYDVLSFARSEGWPIVHVQHLQDGDLFGRGSDTADFIDGFVPEAGETLAVKGNYSAFSSAAFVQFVDEHADHEFVVIGYGSTMCCLSTIVDGYHRGNRFAFVEDACAARASRELSEASMHAHATAILEPFARLTCAGVETLPEQRPLAA